MYQVANTQNARGLHQSKIDLDKMQNKTPLILSEVLSEIFECNVWFKLESTNITGSHKDRECVQIIRECQLTKQTKVGCASSGNLSMSLAYYAWVAGMECHLWVSSKTSSTILEFLNSFGARIYITDQPLCELYEVSNRALKKMGAYNANPGQCSAKIIGNATIANEIHQQLPQVDTVICPVNNGSLLVGLDRGLEDYIRLIGAYSHSTQAKSINAFLRTEGVQTINTILARRQGFLVQTQEVELRQTTIELLKQGIFAEPSAAASIAALKSYTPKSNEHVCCVITGSGLKSGRAIHDLLFHFN